LSDDLVALEPRVLRLWRLRAGITVAPATVATAVVGAVTVGPAAAVAAAVAVAVALAGIAWWWTALVWRAWQFRVGDGALHLRHGVLTRRESTIPFHRVQHIDLEAGPLERRLRLRTLVLRTASASSDSTVPGIDAAHAEDLRRRILALVGTGDAV
jgi:membrane protein YdbS with pleckstrin-like domain